MKKNKHARRLSAHVYILSEDNARETRCTGKFCPDYPWKEEKLLLVLRLDLPNSVILPLTGPTSAFEKWYGHGTS